MKCMAQSLYKSDKELKSYMRKYYANANMLLRKFSYCSPDVKCCMFKSDCSTMCCSSMWLDRHIYKDTTRRVLNLSKYNSVSEMFVNLNISSFDEFCKNTNISL